MRARLAFALLGIAIFAAPAAFAAAVGSAVPPIVAPGETVTLTYTVDDAPLVTASVAEDVVCAVLAPDGSSSDCGSVKNLVSADVQGGRRSVVFEVAAAEAPGTYTVQFTRSSLLTVQLPLGAPQDAEATFVVSRSTPLEADRLDAPGTPDTGTDAGPGAGDVATRVAPAFDGVRWLLSIFLASATLIACVGLVGRGE